MNDFTDASAPQHVANIGEKIVSMTEFNGRILVATEHRIFEVKGNQLIPIMFRLEAR